MTLNEVYWQGKNILTKVGIESPAFDVMCIFEFCFNLNRQQTILFRNNHADEVKTAKFFNLVSQRANGRPLQYILGYWNFMGSKFKIGEGALIPRDDTEVLDKIQRKISGREIVLIAPGKTVSTDTDEILKYINSNDCCVISVNFVPKELPVDMMFISNMKRFSDAEAIKKENIYTIATSNIDVNSEESIGVVNYRSFLNPDPRIADSAGLMCINLLRKLECTKIRLAGFDGFNQDLRENYAQERMMTPLDIERVRELNEAISNRLKEIKSQIDLDFITKTWYSI